MILCRHRTLSGKLVVLACIIAFLMVPVWGCSQKEEGEKIVSKDEKETSPVVARVGTGSITAADFKSYLTARPVPRRNQPSKDELEKRLDEMVLQEVLYQEALRLKLDQDPEMRRRIHQMLSHKLLNDHLKREVANRKIDEKELQAYYDQHRDEFNRLAQVRVADIFIAVPEGATDEEKDKLREKADKVLSEALAGKGKRFGFGKLVRTYSDTHKKYRKGDTGFFDIEGKPVGINQTLAKAAFGLERTGSMAAELIKTPGGYHVIMLVGKRAAINKPLDAVGNQIKQRIRRETAAETRQTYINSLKEKAEIHIDTQVVSGIAEELKAKVRKRRPLQGKPKIPSQRPRADTPPPLKRPPGK
jgi:peptidyl-prolyl cis-trans isomerase C